MFPVVRAPSEAPTRRRSAALVQRIKDRRVDLGYAWYSFVQVRNHRLRSGSIDRVQSFEGFEEKQTNAAGGAGPLGRRTSRGKTKNASKCDRPSPRLGCELRSGRSEDRDSVTDR